MGIRNSLTPGSIIKMPNRGQYVIDEKIGEGGLSLIYSAKTKNNGYPVIIKEFFPAEYAHRAQKTVKADDGRIIAQKGCVYPDNGHEDRFRRCLNAFEQEGQLGSCARRNNFQIISFADCGEGYAVLPRWSNDSCSFEELVRGWRQSPPVSADCVSPDFGRLHFALTAISSLLSAVASIHEQNMLHLDISATNVVWSGHSRTTPENGATFLTDFGCSVLMAEGEPYPAEYVLSYSKSYAAPEYALKDGELTRATDIYSVGRLLTFLCLDQRAFYKHSKIKDLIGRLHIPQRFRNSLLTIIEKATQEQMCERYQSAAEMQEAVSELLSAIPAHPINPDNSKAFSLYSLKSMLEGSLDTRYSWAHELCDRRGVTMDIPAQLHQPVSNLPNRRFADDTAFLRAVLPKEIFQYLSDQISKETDRQFAVNSIMSGNYPAEWKTAISNQFSGTYYQLPDLFAKCRTLLHSERTLKDSISFLFRISGADISYFEYCYTQCAFEIRNALYKGFALLVIFALLGEGESGFAAFAQHSPSEICKLLRR